MKETRRRALQTQIDRLQSRLEGLRRTSYRYTWIRLVIVVAGLSSAGLAFLFLGVWASAASITAFGLAFGIAVYYHRQIDQSITRHETWLQIKAAQIARMQLDWARIPVAFGYRPQNGHAFELDLDLVGERSLYRLLDTAVSYEGSQRLRTWLTAPEPDPRQTVRRQALVRELIPLSLFRDKLILNAILAAGIRKTWEANQLVSWLERHAPMSALRVWLLLGVGMALVNAALFVSNRLGLIAPVWRVTFLFHLGLLFWRSRVSGIAMEEALALQDALGQLGAVFYQFERFARRDAPHLTALLAPFRDGAHRPSSYLKRVARVVAALGVRQHPIVWFLLNAPLPWDFYFAHQLDRHKRAIARHAPGWMDVWFELEALSSLANLAYLNPHYTLPQILVDGPPPAAFAFRAQHLGHPLIPDEDKVCNDFAVAELGQVTLITGSNMAGKSVFLKTVGVNLALALAGGPVDAQHLETLPFRLFTSMRVSDSLTDGISFFYAEVKRLKALLAALESDHPLPLCFFIDEIFRGTNNRERLLGSRAYVRALAGQRGVGLIATHDLELARLADQVPQVENYHFRDHFVDGRMIFDYTLCPGPCPTTNALKIMQMEGLPVSL